MSNWTKPRQHLLEIATELIRRGYTVEGVAESMTRLHFESDLEEIASKIKYTQWSNRIAEVNRMAAELQAEGWRFIEGHNGIGGFWRHPTLGDVNNGGGFFPTCTEATRRAYNSEVRKWL